ncbi:hypothetical protein EMIT0P4_60098 [Pseudomonas sp. IT-P4]
MLRTNQIYTFRFVSATMPSKT